MNLEHGSYAFPSEIIPLLDLVLWLLGVVVFVVWKTPFERWRIGSTGWPSTKALVAGAFVAGALGLALSFAVLGPPVPQVPDEIDYLFAAETYADGRLTNPPHPLGRRLAYLHMLDVPTRQCKYPPGQGLLLALGVLLGHPAIALVLGTGLLVAVTVAVLLRFVEVPWALFGGLLVLLRIGVGGYWNQSYWGGTLAAIAGWVALAALGRWPGGPGKPGEIGRAVALALGFVGLAATRPIEGAALAVVIGGVFLARWFDRSLTEGSARGAKIAGVVVAVVLGLIGLALLLGYNRAVTGSAWVHPHRLYSALEEGVTHFVWEEPLPMGWHLVDRMLVRMGLRASYVGFYVLGIGGSVVALATLVMVWRRSDLRRTGRVCGLAIAAVLVALGVVRPFHVHYGSPMVAPMVLLLILGLRELRRSSWRPELTRAVAPALLAGNALLCLAQLPAHRPDPEQWAARRTVIQRRIEAEPGRHLVLVDDHAGQYQSWSFPVPDPMAARIVWVDLAGLEPAQIAGQLGERQVWLLELERDREQLRRLDL